MGEAAISIRFDGGDASHNVIDMRLYGMALQGMERIISDGIILISARRLPKRGERAPLIVKAKEAVIGSHETPGIIAENSHLLQLGWSLLSMKGDEIIFQWVSFVLNWLGGNKEKADEHLDALMETQKMHLDASERADERRHAEARQWREFALQLVDKLAGAGVQAVAPVGPSARTMDFSTREGAKPFTVDEPMADVIRSKGQLEVEPMMEMTLKTDGFAYHNRTVTVVHPEQPGRFILAHVQDPAFDQEPNLYSEAASKAASIRAMCKIARLEGAIKKIYLMDFIGIAE
jgi:hypothetical protein